MPIKTVIYTRVSTEEQGKGYSLPTQLEGCRNFAQNKGYEIVGEFSDMHTGTELSRPGLDNMYDCINLEAAQYVIVYDIDRLSREVSIQAIIEMEMARLGVTINYVIGNYELTPEGELLKLVKSGIAQYENRSRVERCRRGRLGKARAGYIVCPAGRAPFGYNYIQDGHKSWFEINEDQAKVVRQIYSWLVDDGISSYIIAKKLWEGGILSKGDFSSIVYKKFGRGEWSPSTIRKIVGNSTYKGVWYYNKTRMKKLNGKHIRTHLPKSEWIPVNVPAIVDEMVWEKAQERLVINQKYAHKNTQNEYLLRSVVYCPCGRRWTVLYRKFLKRAYYRCPTSLAEYWRQRCLNNFSIRQEILEQVVWGKIKWMFFDVDALKLMLENHWIEYLNSAKFRDDKADEIRLSIAEIDRKLGVLLDQLLEEQFTKSLIEPRQKILMFQRANLERELRKVNNEDEKPRITPEQVSQVLDFANKLSSTIDDMDYYEKRRIVEKLQLKVLIIDRANAQINGMIENGLIVAITTGPAR